MQVNIKILEAKDGNKTISINDVLIHSKYKPIEEAKNWANSNESKNSLNDKRIIIYGLGLGYHILELLKSIDSDVEVVVLDIIQDIFKISYEYGVLEKIEEYENVNVVKTSTYKEFLDKFSEEVSKGGTFLIHSPSIRCLGEEYKDFKEIIDDYKGSIGIMEMYQEAINYNKINNPNIYSQSINEFFKKYNFKGEKVIIVASGPSLDYELENLKSVQGKIKIFAVGSALKSLINAGIKPDMFCLLDPQEIVYHQIEGLEDLDIPLCFLYTASNKAIREYKGPKYIFYNCKVDGERMIEVGNTVTTVPLSIAIEGRASEIIFVGLDLAYINNRTHSSNTMYGNTTVAELNKNLFEVEGVNGTKVYSTKGFMMFKWWIEKKIEKNPNIKFINHSRGARINGTIEEKGF